MALWGNDIKPKNLTDAEKEGSLRNSNWLG